MGRKEKRVGCVSIYPHWASQLYQRSKLICECDVNVGSYMDPREGDGLVKESAF